ncbi:MAG TPA: tyrosine-type recombinase/integrase, partial [Bacteroidales bacterium]|nr:tyrosine-type recombinase/integrase [Bacteroidales bacterium]
MHSKTIRLVNSDHFASELYDYLGYCQIKNLSINTIGFYKDRLNSFFKFCSTEFNLTTPEEVSISEVRAFIRYSMDAGRSIKTINHNTQAIKAFYNYLLEEGRVSISPAVRVKPLKQEKKIIQTFSPNQVEALLAGCNKHTFVGLRNYTIMLTLLDTGLRVSELCGLKMQDIDRSAGLLKVMGKGSKERMVPFGASLKRILLEYLKRRGEVDNEDHVFLNQYGEQMDRYLVLRMMQDIGKKSGVSDVRVSPHTFRHTFAKNWILAGGDSFSLQKILGHTTQEMVSQYVNLATGDIRIQHSKFSPVDRMIP